MNQERCTLKHYKNNLVENTQNKTLAIWLLKKMKIIYNNLSFMRQTDELQQN